MEDEEDDFYDPTDSVPAGQAQNNNHNAAPEQYQDGYEDEEEEEVEDDDVWLQRLTSYRAY
jgi:pre-mRNA 3'-end-processing factor FIP1